MRVVLDANVYVIALIRPEGPPGLILRLFLRGDAFDLVLSPAIVEETLRAFTYPKVRKYLRAKVDPALWFEDIVLLAHLVDVKASPSRISVDPDDDKYLAAAVSGGASLVVSGDPDLPLVGEFERVRIITPKAFLDRLLG